MRTTYADKIEKARILTGEFATQPGDRHGLFLFKLRNGTPCKVIASAGEGWDHVSISLKVNRCPFWEEMCELKDLFFEEQEEVMQLHPPKHAWVNNVKNCLHLWRPQEQKIPMPPSSFVGISEVGLFEEMSKEEFRTVKENFDKGLIR